MHKISATWFRVWIIEQLLDHERVYFADASTRFLAFRLLTRLLLLLPPQLHTEAFQAPLQILQWFYICMTLLGSQMHA